MALALDRYDSIVFMTGAGISRPSGLPTFRGDPDSLWNDGAAERASVGSVAMANPRGFWANWGPFRTLASEAEPNEAHKVIARLEDHVEEVVVLTQNVDELHTRAGSTDVIELHGNAFYNSCRTKRCPQERWRDETPRTRPVTCPTCGEFAFPAVVMFGEYLDRQDLKRAWKEAEHCDLYIVVGSSGYVPPATNIVYATKNRKGPWRDAEAILVNMQEWDHPDDVFDRKIFGPCEETLPELLGV